jgi:hypothetical protein
MGNNAVITLAVGFQPFWSLTHCLMQRYAERIHADFIAIRSAPTQSELTASYKLSKFQIKDYLDQYDRVLFLDGDIILHPQCPDFFPLVPESELGVVCESLPYFDRRTVFQETCAFYGVTYPGHAQEWFNTGMMVLSPLHRSLFTLPPHIREFTARNMDGTLAPGFSWLDMPLLNAIRLMEGLSLSDLGYRFNYLQPLAYLTSPPFSPELAWIYHGAGADKSPLYEMAQRWYPDLDLETLDTHQANLVYP